MSSIGEIVRLLIEINSVDDLVSFLDDNYEKIQRIFYGSNFDDLKANRSLTENLLFHLEDKKLINTDNNHQSINAFLITLADFYDRFQSKTEVIVINKYLPDCSVKKRLKAAEVYLLANNVDDFIIQLNSIIGLLNEAYQEEDFKHRISISLVNYYLFAFGHLRRVSEEKLTQFQVNFKSCYGKYEIFDSELVEKVINHVSNSNFEKDFQSIQDLIRDLEINCLKLYLPEINIDVDFTEENSDYEREYKGLEVKNFDLIKDLSFRFLPEDSTLFSKLQRGTAIIDQTELLYQYVFSYGSMHQCKLIDSFKSLSINDLTGRTIDIIDYGCGLGLATMVLNDFLTGKGINVTFKSIILIEPSEIALKRAYLHVKYGPDSFSNAQIIPINKDLNSIDKTDLATSRSNIKVHLFSNILDVPFFDLDLLIGKLMLTQSGVNYFICVSPNVDDLRNNRLDYFFNIFSKKFNTTLFSNRNNNKIRDKWRCKRFSPPSKCNNHDLICFCANAWTRYEQIFKVSI